jgi:hypothetical protein
MASPNSTNTYTANFHCKLSPNQQEQLKKIHLHFVKLDYPFSKALDEFEEVSEIIFSSSGQKRLNVIAWLLQKYDPQLSTYIKNEEESEIQSKTYFKSSSI